MKFAIDEINCYKTALFVSGWAQREVGDSRLEVYIETPNNRVIGPSSLRIVRRQDLSDLLGPEAVEWGFSAVFLFAESDLAYRAAQFGLTLKSGKFRAQIQAVGATVASMLSIGTNAANQEFMRRVNAAPHGRLLEVGSRARSGISRRGLFAKHDYVGLDIMPGENVDIVCDAHDLSKSGLKNLDFVVSTSVFEHLIMPWKVAIELAKVMKIGALIQTNTNQCWPIHDSPWDFWRFSDSAWSAIFNRFTGFQIIQTCMFEPVHVVPATESGAGALRFGMQHAYAGSACLAEKICEPKVDWCADAFELSKGLYPA